MKLTIKAEQLKFLILGAGGLGFVLRIALYAIGIDGRGLLESGHWAHIAVWVLTAAIAVVLLICCRSLTGPEELSNAYPPSATAALGAFAAMAGIGITTLREFSEFSSRIHLAVWVLGLCATIAMAFIGLCRFRGKKTYFLLHVVVCVYFALRMVSRYRLWSSDPQLQDYCFYLTAYVALMLTAYHHAAFNAGMGSHKLLWFFSLAAVYLCCLSLKGNTDTVLLLGCGVWAFANLTHLTVQPRRQRPALDLSEDSNHK